MHHHNRHIMRRTVSLETIYFLEMNIFAIIQLASSRSMEQEKQIATFSLMHQLKTNPRKTQTT